MIHACRVASARRITAIMDLHASQIQGFFDVPVDNVCPRLADTCGTLDLAAERLIGIGVERVIAIVTHGVLSGPALTRITKSKLEKLVVPNPLPQSINRARCAKIDEASVHFVSTPMSMLKSLMLCLELPSSTD
ncbi:hypothetical protein CF326_g9807 [Tilletia indica]|nr:hypothetical protein CF326_g9807 [Tilletia indica]